MMNEKMNKGCSCLMPCFGPPLIQLATAMGKKQQPWGKPGQWPVVSETVLLIVRENRGKMVARMKHRTLTEHLKRIFYG
jgi:hypothetical protein